MNQVLIPEPEWKRIVAILERIDPPQLPDIISRKQFLQHIGDNSDWRRMKQENPELFIPTGEGQKQTHFKFNYKKYKKK